MPWGKSLVDYKETLAERKRTTSNDQWAKLMEALGMAKSIWETTSGREEAKKAADLGYQREQELATTGFNRDRTVLGMQQATQEKRDQLQREYDAAVRQGDAARAAAILKQQQAFEKEENAKQRENALNIAQTNAGRTLANEERDAVGKLWQDAYAIVQDQLKDENGIFPGWGNVDPTQAASLFKSALDMSWAGSGLDDTIKESLMAAFTDLVGAAPKGETGTAVTTSGGEPPVTQGTPGLAETVLLGPAKVVGEGAATFGKNWQENIQKVVDFLKGKAPTNSTEKEIQLVTEKLSKTDLSSSDQQEMAALQAESQKQGVDLVALLAKLRAIAGRYSKQIGR